MTIIQAWTIALICFGSLCTRAQTVKWHLEATSHAGTVVKHTDKINIQSGSLIPGAEIGVFRNTSGQSGWQRYYHAPQYGIAAIWFNPGGSAHGNAIGLIPCLTIPFSNRSGHGMVFRIGTGIGYVSKPYHFLENPIQNAIGTHWNNAVQLRFGWRQKKRNFTWQIGGAFTHFSNGGAAQPNFGINMPSAFLSIGTNRGKTIPEAESAQKMPEPITLRPWGLSLHTQYKRVRYHIVQDGPKYPIYGFSGSAYYRMHRYNRFHLGLDYERNQAVYQWFIHATGGADAAIVRKGSDRLAIFLANEFLFADFGIYLQTSRYIGKDFNAWTLGTYYNKLSVRYYLPSWRAAQVKPVLSLQLKAHKAIAEYIAFGAGFEF
jgi:hypothetical protein